MIRLEHVTKEFHIKKDKVTAVNDVNLSIHDGEIFGIIGFSGAGKSTLVRCINLLETPTSGDVYIGDVNLVKARPKELRSARQKIGMIFQQFNLLEQRNVLLNVCYPLEISGVTKKQAKDRALELLKLVDLEEKVNAFPAQLSGGQKQRVAIARALATNPEVLLCDEATSALDPLTTRSILELLKEINRTLGVTIIVITHEMRVVEQICDRVAIMSQGRIEETGTVSEVFRNPKSETGRKLVLPDENAAVKAPGKSYLRIVFEGQSSYDPVLADLIMQFGHRFNILGANTEDIGGKAFGQLLIERPDDEELVRAILQYLDERNIHVDEVEV